MIYSPVLSRTIRRSRFWAVFVPAALGPSPGVASPDN
jgi:hypothetical protein